MIKPNTQARLAALEQEDREILLVDLDKYINKAINALESTPMNSGRYHAIRDADFKIYHFIEETPEEVIRDLRERNLIY